MSADQSKLSLPHGFEPLTAANRAYFQACLEKGKLAMQLTDDFTTTAVGADGLYERELEINGYCQSARWSVTHRGALDHIQKCDIQSRGEFFQEGREPPPGERREYLLIRAKEAGFIGVALLQIRAILLGAEEQAARHRAHPTD